MKHGKKEKRCMGAFELHIKNIGKLADAKIRIGQFTVLAGPNNTGKSTVSKLLYSLFDGVNANHVELELNKLIKPIHYGLSRLEHYFPMDSVPYLREMQTLLRKLEGISESCSSSENQYEDEFDAFQNVSPNMISVSTEMKATNDRLKKFIKESLGKWGVQQQDPLPLSEIRRRREEDIVEETHKEISESIKALQQSLEKSPEKFIVSGIASKIFQNLMQNFQVPNLSYLRSQPRKVSNVNVGGIGDLKFEDNNTVSFPIDRTGIRLLQNYSRVIYLESPIYWKLKKPLKNARRSRRFYAHIPERARLNGVPGYFYDFIDALEEQYTGEIAFPELYKKLTSAEVINGKITLSAETGELLFQENGHTFPLSMTAMGVVNLGILALLIERRTIDRGSFLFIDEPEAHLHPAWQVIMAETLFELAKGGAHVVIATHSADILKWLEVHVKKNPEDQDLIALNKFPANGNATVGQDFGDQIAAIKQELTKPFADLYTAGL